MIVTRSGNRSGTGPGLQAFSGVLIFQNLLAHFDASPRRLFSFATAPAPRHTRRKRQSSVGGFVSGGSKVGDRSVKLREAASTIFALTAILPLLVFVYFMWRFELLGSTVTR